MGLPLQDYGVVSPAVPVCCLRVTMGPWTHLSTSLGSADGQALRVTPPTRYIPPKVQSELKDGHS